MKKISIALGATLLMTRIISAQEGVSTPGASTTTTPSRSTPTPTPAASPTTAQADQVTVTSQELDVSREAIVPSLGATRYTIGPDRLDSHARRENRAITQTKHRF